MGRRRQEFLKLRGNDSVLTPMVTLQVLDERVNAVSTATAVLELLFPDLSQ